MKQKGECELLSVEDWLNLLNASDTVVSVPNSYCINRALPFRSRRQQTRYHLLIFVLQGSLYVETSSANFELHAGSALWLPPDTDRLFSSKGQSKSYRIHINVTYDGKQLNWLDKPHLHRNSWELHPLFEKLWRINRFGDVFKPQQIRALLTLISIHLSRSSVELFSGNRLTLAQCQKVEDFIQHNLSDPITARDIADELQMTRSYVTRLFKNTYNLPPRQFIKEERLNKAAVFLIDSTLQIKQIAHMVGISNLGLFCRQFKDHFGLTPSSYRQTTVRQNMSKRHMR